MTTLANTHSRVALGQVEGGRPSGPSHQQGPSRAPSHASQTLSALALRPADDWDEKPAREGVGHNGVSRGALRELRPKLRGLDNDTGSRGWKK